MSTTGGCTAAHLGERQDPPDGWWPVAMTSQVTTTPLAVRTGDREWVAFRPAPGAPASVVEARCPHRLVSLAHGAVVDGRLQCAYHGWQFEPGGTCALIPSYGPDYSVPDRANLLVPWGVRERDGLLWVAPVDPGTGAAGTGAAGTGAVATGDPGTVDPGTVDPGTVDPGTGEQTARRPRATAPDTRGTTQVLTNLDPSLESGWHPVALASELARAHPLQVRLLGRGYELDSGLDGVPFARAVDGEAPPAMLMERFGALWLAPLAPRVDLLECADDSSLLFAPGWLVPERSASAAGVLAENFLDVAHFPFVHAGTFGAAEDPVVAPFEVEVHGDGAGSSSVQEQWFDNLEDPGVLAGTRPVRQRRRATYTYRWPFQLVLRLEELDAGAIKTILFFLQPEDTHSTRIYTKMLLHGIGGVAVPDADVVAREVAFEVAVLAEDLQLQRAMTVPGLPLRTRDELHVRSDRSGVALRRVLSGHLI